MTQQIYQVGGGVKNEAYFFGREDQLELIRQSLSSNDLNHLLLVGGRMQGKSSILHAIQRRAQGWGWDCHYLPTYENYHERIERAPDVSLWYSQDRQTPRVLLIDEADGLVEGNESQRRKTLRGLRDFSGKTHASVLLAGDWKLAQAARSRPFDNFGPTMRVDPLSPADAHTLIRRPETLGLQFESTELVERIAHESGCQPYLISLICDKLVESGTKRINSRITEGEVEDVLRSFSVRDKFSGWREILESYHSLKWSPALIEQSSKMSGYFTLEDLSHQFSQLAPSKQAIDQLLDFLSMSGWLLRSDVESYSFLPLFRRELQRVTGTQPILSESPQEGNMSQRFRVALTFPGKHRQFAKSIADLLAHEFGKPRVFYDKYHQADLLRTNLDIYLQDIYRNRSDFIVAFVSKFYNESKWCGLEWRVVRELLMNRTENLIVIRLDDSEIPGLLSLDGYISPSEYDNRSIAKMIVQRIRQARLA